MTTLEAPPERSDSHRTAGNIETIPIGVIEHHLENHRAAALADEAKLQALADSLSAQGLLQPIKVFLSRSTRRNPRYLLVYGHRRLEAARRLGWTEIRAEVCQPMTDAQVLLERAIENLHRQDLNPMEQVTAVEQALDANSGNIEQTAKQLGVSQAFVKDRLALSQRLCDRAREVALMGYLSLGVLRELVKLRDHRDQAEAVDEICTDYGADDENALRVPTVEQARREVRRSLQDLGSAGWSLDEPFAGKRACRGCPSNTASEPDLFGEMAMHCTDSSCFTIKRTELREVVRIAADKLAKAKVAKPKQDDLREAIGDRGAGWVDLTVLGRQVRTELKYKLPQTPPKKKLSPLQQAIQKYQDATGKWESGLESKLAKLTKVERAMVILLWHAHPWCKLKASDDGWLGQYSGQPRAPRPDRPLSQELRTAIGMVSYGNLAALAELSGVRVTHGIMHTTHNRTAMHQLAIALKIDHDQPPKWSDFAPAKEPAKKKAARKKRPKKGAA